MAITFSRPDPSEPSAVSAATFTPSRRGFDQAEVRDFLRMVAAEMARLRERERFLEHELRVAQSSNPNPAVVVDDELVTKMLGEEAARILQTAREAASQIKIRAEEQAARLVREASEESTRVRDDAEQEALRRRDDAAADAEAEVQMAKQQGREMVEEARAYRERVLADLAQRRELARQQIEQIVHGRDRLVQAFERARLAAVDVIAELSSVGEPGEYVNLSPTTGPVPLMLPNTPRPVAERAPAVEIPAVEPTPVADEPVAVETVADEIVADETVEQTTEVAAGASGIYDVELEDDLDDTPAHELSIDVVDATDLEVEPEIDVEVDAEHDDAEHDDAEHDDAVHDDAVHDDAVHDDAEHDDRPIAPVVSLFGGETAEHPSMQTPPPPSAPKQSVDDLFARLKAARTDTVAEQTSTAAHPVERSAPPSVFDASPPKPDTAPVATTTSDDTDPAAESPFARRDRALEPLLVAATRKMKRTLADEQNDALAVLRRRQPVIGLDALVPKATDHAARFADAVDAELTAASLAGGSSVDDRGEAAHERAITDARALHSAIEMINDTIVAPLRERLGRAVADAEGDNGVIADHVRSIYREWKTQRIDGQLDEVLRLAFGCGALAAAVPGTPLCWAVDPNGPECPDAEDNALAGRVGAGDPFPTDHLCAPAHAGCRCMLVRAD